MALRPCFVRAVALGAVLGLGTTLLAGQEPPEPCLRGAGNRLLASQLRAGAVPRLRHDENRPRTWQGLASSFRWPDGPTPEDAFEHAYWTCAYTGYRAWDSEGNTAWCEGLPGDGIGEVVLAPVETDSVQVVAGEAHSDSAFAASNRPRRVRVYLLHVRESWGGAGGAVWHRLRVLGSGVVELRDTAEAQLLPLPAPRYVARAVSDLEIHFVAVQLLSVYRGGAGRHTCITDIR